MGRTALHQFRLLCQTTFRDFRAADRRAPPRRRVLGHIGMLHTVVDVTNVNCKLGDKAIFDVNPLMLKGVDVVFQ